MLSKIYLRIILIGFFLAVGFIEPMQAQADPVQGVRKVDKASVEQFLPQKERGHEDQAAHPDHPVKALQPAKQKQPSKGRNASDVQTAPRKRSDHRVYMTHNFAQDLHMNHKYGLDVDANPVVVDIPSGFTAVNLNGQRYYYNVSLNIYYQEEAQGFVPIPAPIGAVVGAIPAHCSIENSNGINYYICNGVDYTWTVDGYRVVSSSVSMDQESSVMDANAPAGNSPASFTINIPKINGEYVPVILTRSGNGFIGPQGEFYAQFPAVSLLGVIYGQ